MQNTNLIKSLSNSISKELNLSSEDTQIIFNALMELPEFTFGTDYIFHINPDDLTIDLLDATDPDIKGILPNNLCNPQEDNQFYYLWETPENPDTDSIFFFIIY